MTEATEYDIEVTVVSQFEANNSNPDEHCFRFSYQVRIENHGTVAAQLLSRHWIILDGNGDKTEVEGEGVVGAKPTLAPGDSFEYRSGAELRTPVGTMYGTYQMLAANGIPFLATIPAFSLSVPHMLH